ncbi:MAG: hypothetical protein AAFQ52_09895 [Chloroflexota bacterium]
MMMRRFLLVVSLFILSVSGHAQETDDEINALDESITAIESYVETVRELESTAPITVHFPTREAVQTFLAGEFEAFYTDDVVARESAFYQAFGLVPFNYDLVTELTALYGEQVAGYYDTETEVMNVILSSGEQPEDRLPFLDRVIYAHEYVHALQDQYFDLDAFYAPVIDGANADALLARQALIEGDATVVMTAYTQAVTEANPLGTLLDLGTSLLNISNATIPADTPRVIEQELTFPYFGGQIFVQALLNEGGWELVNTAFTDAPPLSTEHILHPETYLAGEIPIAVSLTDQSADLGDSWSLVRTGVLGEFYMREWLQTQDAVPDEMILAGTTGWGGDAYHIYQDANGALAYELSIVWDDEAEADEFYSDALLFYGNSVGGFTPVSIYEDSATFCWLPATRTLCVVRDGATMTITQAPTRNVALMLLNEE